MNDGQPTVPDRKMLDRYVLMLIVLAAGCSAATPLRPAERQDPRCANIVLPPLTVSPADWSRLETSLQHHYDVWRARLVGARCHRLHGEVARLEAERVTVSIDYGGDVVGALRAAGLQTGYDAGGQLSGQIGLRELEQLAGVPGIVRMTMQPEVHPD
jgi:hypothetical protein